MKYFDYLNDSLIFVNFIFSSVSQGVDASIYNNVAYTITCKRQNYK